MTEEPGGFSVVDRIETLYFGGPILTMDSANNRVEAVGVAGGLIVFVGTLAAATKQADDRTRRVDLAGRTLLPAFIDPHGHFPLSGVHALYRVNLMGPPLGQVRTLDDVLARLAEKARTTAAGRPVMGGFFDQTTIEEGRFPNRLELDRVSHDRPVVVMHMSGHVCATNSVGLALAGVGPKTPQPVGGFIERDPISGEPTGLLEEPAAMGPLCGELFDVSPERFDAALHHAALEYASVGVTTAQNSFADSALLHGFAEAARRNDPNIRVVVLPDGQDPPQSSQPELANMPFKDGPIRIGPRKLFADGSIQVFTAFLSEPYHTPYRGDTGHRGYLLRSREALARDIADLHNAGHQVHVHTNGDAAGDVVLDAFEQALNRRPRDDHRHTLIHGQTLRSDQLERMAKLGVSVSFFSFHVYVWGDRHREIFLGPERAARISPAAEALANGVRLTIHNDTPVTPMQPLPLIWCAVNRLTASGRELGVDQALTATQALRAHTIDAAWQVGLEAELGSIEPGKCADFVVLGQNPVDDPASIKDIAVTATIKEGVLIYGKI